MTDRHDERMLVELDRLASNADPQGAEAPADRELTELFGLLAYDLEPRPPRPALKEELLQRVGANSSSEPADRGPVVAPERRGGRAAEWLAAAAVLAALVLGGLDLFLLGRVRAQSEVVAELNEEVEGLRSRVQEAADGGSRIATLTSPQTMVCPLKSRDPDQPEATGVMFMDPMQQRWFLTANKLAPSPPGQLYEVWFVTTEGSVRGDTFEVVDGVGGIELTAEDLPDGTKAVMITIASGESDTPGPMVLYGDEAQHFF